MVAKHGIVPALFLAGLVLLQPGLANAADLASLIKTVAVDLCGTFATVCVTIGLVGAGASFFSSHGDMHAVVRVMVPWAIAAAVALGATTLVATFGFSS